MLYIKWVSVYKAHEEEELGQISARVLSLSSLLLSAETIGAQSPIRGSNGDQGHELRMCPPYRSCSSLFLKPTGTIWTDTQCTEAIIILFSFSMAHKTLRLTVISEVAVVTESVRGTSREMRLHNFSSSQIQKHTRHTQTSVSCHTFCIHLDRIVCH